MRIALELMTATGQIAHDVQVLRRRQIVTPGRNLLGLISAQLPEPVSIVLEELPKPLRSEGEFHVQSSGRLSITSEVNTTENVRPDFPGRKLESLPSTSIRRT